VASKIRDFDESEVFPPINERQISDFILLSIIFYIKDLESNPCQLKQKTSERTLTDFLELF